MNYINKISELFKDEYIVSKIQAKLPILFQIAELETSRAGKIGMEVGILRERIIVALLIYKFGENNVFTKISATQTEIDAFLYDIPISVKTLSGKELSGVKLIWTVDPDIAKLFKQNYEPKIDILFVHINWKNRGGLYFIPNKVQLQVFNEIGSDNYLKLPKEGTNPRGVELSSLALKKLLANNNTMHIPIDWIKQDVAINNYERWVELWRQD